MASPCYYHPDQSAVGNCVQCGLPICANCTDRVGDKTVCHKCVQTVKARLEAQMAAAPAGTYGSPPPATGYGAGNYGSPAPNFGNQSFGGTAVTLAPERIEPGVLILGIVAALLVGIVGAVIVEKMLFMAGFGLSLLYVGIGYGVGFALHKVIGRGGTGMALLAVGIMFVSLLIGQLVYTADVLGQLRTDHPEATGLTTAAVFPIVLEHMSPMHWVCVVIGLFACFRGVNSQE